MVYCYFPPSKKSNWGVLLCPALPERARRGIPRRCSPSWEISAVRRGRGKTVRLPVWTGNGCWIPSPSPRPQFRRAPRVCVLRRDQQRRGDKWKIRFSSGALCRAGCGGFEAHQSSAKRSGLWGNIFAWEQAKNTSVKCHPALCCHNTFG